MPTCPPVVYPPVSMAVLDFTAPKTAPLALDGVAELSYSGSQSHGVAVIARLDIRGHGISPVSRRVMPGHPTTIRLHATRGFKAEGHHVVFELDAGPFDGTLRVRSAHLQVHAPPARGSKDRRPRAADAGVAYEPEMVAAEVGPVRLELPAAQEPRLGEHTFTFARNLDYCGPMGTRRRTVLREVPRSPLVPHPSAVITVIVAFPAYRIPEVCPPIPYLYETIRVRTKRLSSSLRFFDGSYEPPRLIWPRPKGHGSRWAGPTLPGS